MPAIVERYGLLVGGLRLVNFECDVHADLLIA
jgi:hypothetical protein